MNSPPYVFDLDHVAKIRSELSITVLDKKNSAKLPIKKNQKMSFRDSIFTMQALVITFRGKLNLIFRIQALNTIFMANFTIFYDQIGARFLEKKSMSPTLSKFEFS